jgi:DNA-directed RNA polymerase subunit alpha
VKDETVSTPSFARFTIEPFEQGYGTTIGNSLRRVLLSSLDGAAVTSVKIAGVSHEFTHLEGVLEDVTDIILNIKEVVLRATGEGTRTVTVSRDKAGEIKAGDFVVDPSLAVINPDRHIATLTTNVRFQAEMSVRRGRGYATAAENRTPEQELGVIPIDAVFSPVLRVRFRTEDMRVGQRTNYDRLILEIWTNGTILPEDALVEAGLILRKHLSPFIMYHELGRDVVVAPRVLGDQSALGEAGPWELLNKPVSALTLSVRAGNCLEAAGIKLLRDLVVKTEADLLRFRSFGKTSLHEVQRKLADVGLRLGMSLSEGGSSSGSGGASPGSAYLETTAVGSSSLRTGLALGAGESSASGSGPMEVYTMGE